MELTTIKNSIHEIRGKRVILDYELAKMYEVETRVLKQAVRRNLDRFPEDFMVELTDNEMKNLVSQNVIPSLKYFGGARVYAFTEQGVAMLSSVLKSKLAIQINISIMRAFVMMRQWTLTHQELSEKLTALEKQHQQKFKDIDQVLTYLLQKDQIKTNPAPREKVGYKK
ncbi:MAG: ORF6N domain-containing protein [Flavobacteriales bacterium]